MRISTCHVIHNELNNLSSVFSAFCANSLKKSEKPRLQHTINTKNRLKLNILSH